MKTLALIFVLIPALVSAQQAGTLTTDEPLPLAYEECTSSGCETKSAYAVMDANWRWTHDIDGYTNCYTGNEWDETYCPDGATCAENCAIDGISSTDWSGTYGVESDGTSISLKFVTEGPYSTNIGSRVFLLDESGEEYVMFTLLNREFTFDVDTSQLDCGLNGAVYFVEMDSDGGLSYDGNEAGAAFGTGYCDAQCPHDIKWIDGEANCEEWEPSDNDENAGFGYYGSCCEEMDIWEANAKSQAYTVHACSVEGQTRCEGTDCGDTDAGERYDGLCDKDGCDFASYRLGDTEFYCESGCTLDSSSVMTVVTQFITDDGTDTGSLSEIRRIYVQNGVEVANTVADVDGTEYDSITDEFCVNVKEYFGDTDDHTDNGGMNAMGEALGRGVVLALSLWDDHEANMLWLDSTYPTDASEDTPGAVRGPCSTDSGDPADVESEQADATVIYSNIKVGELNTTY